MTPLPSQPFARPQRRAFTLLEVLLTVLIIGIISSMVAVNVSSGDASTRLDRAAQMIIAACRYARIQSLGHAQAAYTTGANPQPQPTNGYGIQIDTAANTVTVYRANYIIPSSKWNLPGGAVSDSLFGTGTCVLSFNTLSTCAGVKITAVSLNGTSDTSANTASPYYCQYHPFGDALNYGTTAITLSYGGQTRTVCIPQVGDATEN